MEGCRLHIQYCDSCRNSSYGCMQWYGRLQATHVVIVAETVAMVVCDGYVMV